MEANYILSSLEAQDRDALSRTARRIFFESGEILCNARERADDVLFPVSGFISAVVPLKDGYQVEVAMIGCGGAFGLPTLFGQKQHLATGIARIRGQAWAVPARALEEVSAGNARLKEILFHYHSYIMAQVQQTAACNARHQIRERLASWLLRASLTAQHDEFSITQGELAIALGVQRASISQAASDLARTRAIDYRRGKIAILDVQALDRWACQCHKDLAEWRKHLLQPNDDLPYHELSKLLTVGALPIGSTPHLDTPSDPA